MSYIPSDLETVKNTIELNASATWTPAYLTGGSSATALVATWIAVTDGSFHVVINTALHDITGLDFSGIDPVTGTMDDVATIIQSGIRSQTTANETCQWSTDHFVINCNYTGSTTSISTTTAVGSGTDISGQGGTPFMDCQSSDGVVIPAVPTPANQSLNCFQVNGDVLITKLYAIITNATTLDNCTGAIVDIFDSGSNQITASTVLSGLPVGTLLAKTGIYTAMLSVLSSASGGIIEPSIAQEVFSQFIANENPSTPTYIRFNYTTTDSPISATIYIYAEYLSLGGGSLVKYTPGPS